LAELLDDHYPLRLVFLNSCEGARGSENDAFSSTAATLVRRGVPAVVAMQYEITDSAAIEFSRDFYEALADNLPVDAAVTEARAAVSMDSMLEWRTPVLYMHSPDGRVFDVLTSSPRAHPPPVTEDRQAEAGADAEPGSSVDVTVSSGPSTQADPDLAGQRPESGVQAPPVQTPPPASTPTRDQNGGQPRRRVPVWTMAVAAIFVLALIVGIVVLISRGQQGGGAEGAVQELTVAVDFDPLNSDSSENMRDLVKRFNEEYKGRYKVTPQEISSLDQLRTKFQDGSDGIDVIGGDITWSAELAEKDWIVNLSDRFHESERLKFWDATIEANTYEDKIWGVPWYTDAGMLYYRKDLLKESGFTNPPKQWGDNPDSNKNTLYGMVGEVMQSQHTSYGFVFQGAEDEGGVVNGLEYIYSYGGQVLDPTDPSKVVIDSDASVQGLYNYGAMVGGSAAPQDVANYTEKESEDAFLSGNAVFCRNWSYMYDLAGTDDYISKDQIGIAPLPAGRVRSVSGLGGRNFFISANSDAKDAAWKFIEFATSGEQQKSGAIEADLLPTRQELYEDQELLDKVPVMDLGKGAIQNAEPPPVSPYYSKMSPVMAKQFNASLKGEVTPPEAIKKLQTKLTKIVEQ
jgi:multiple sugar transport system substrate-binding protein